MSMSIQQKLLASFGMVVFGAARRPGGRGAGHDEQSNGNAARLGARDLRAVNAIGSVPANRASRREGTYHAVWKNGRIPQAWAAVSSRR
jgi:hypothetical protein